MIGESIGPYQLIERLGAGAMGEVFLAEDTRLKRKVALKCLSERRLHSPEAQQRLLLEARAAARLNHPNIAAIYDVIEIGQRGHIVMEYVQGETLAAKLVRGPLPVDEVVRIALQLTEALSEAHAHGVIHRDLKPSNIRITPEGKVKVLDFGLAKTIFVPEADAGNSMATIESAITQVGHVVGTPAYMSPEQISGKEADPRSDIYSLGVVIFEMAVGQRPYQASDFMGYALAIINGTVPDAAGIDPSVPEDLSVLIARLMAKDPSERPQSIAEVRPGLLSISAASGVVPVLPSQKGIAGAVPDRRKRSALWRWAAVPAAILLTALLVYWERWFPFQAPQPSNAPVPIVAVLPFTNTSGDPSNEDLGAGMADVLTARLGAVSGVSVISRSATLPYRDPKRDLKKITRDLGATYVVEGGLQRQNERILITVNLVRAGSKIAEWSHVYDGSMSDIFALQRDLADGLLQALRVNVQASERERLRGAPTTNLDAFADFSRAQAFADRADIPGNLDKATQYLTSALEKDPKFVLAYAALGELYWTRFRLTKDPAWTEKAREATMNALVLDPDQASVRMVLALIYNGTGRGGEAIEQLRRVLVLQPKSDEVHRRMGEILVEHGQLDEGFAELRAAINLRPDFWENYRSLGRAYYQQGRYEEAIPIFRRVTELQPDSSWGFQNLGTCYHNIGNLEQARLNYERANSLNPTGSAYTNLGTIFYAEGKFAEAAQSYEEAIKLVPGNPLYYRNLGDACLRLGQKEKADASFRRAVELNESLLKVNPRDSRALSQLAVCEAKLGRHPSAERHVEDAVRLAPADKDVLYRRSVVYALAGKKSEAIQALREAVARGSSAAEASRDFDLAAVKSLPEFKALVAGPHQ